MRNEPEVSTEMTRDDGEPQRASLQETGANLRQPQTNFFVTTSHLPRMHYNIKSPIVPIVQSNYVFLANPIVVQCSVCKKEPGVNVRPSVCSSEVDAAEAKKFCICGGWYGIEMG